MKWVRRIGSLFSTALLLVLLIAVAAIAVPRFAGIEMRAILSGSMEPAYKIGDMIYAVPTEFEDIREGDVISYVLNEDLTVVTHRVVEIDIENKQFYTQGDANNTRDGSPVLYENVLGVVRLSIPYAGKIIALLDNQTNKIMLLTGIVVLAILAMIIRINLGSDVDEAVKTIEDTPESLRQERAKLKAWEDELKQREIELEKREQEIAASGTVKVIERQENKRNFLFKSIKKIPYQVLVVLAVVLTIGSITLAMLKGMSERRVNNFSLGKVPVEIEETDVDKDNVEWGTETKPVEIRNTGNTDAIVRVLILPILKDKATGIHMGGNLDILHAPNGKMLELGDFTLHFRDTFINSESENWVFNPEDGYFYYKKVLKPDHSSSRLLTGVTLTNPDDKSKYVDIDVEIQVFTDSLQAFGNAPVEWNAEVDDGEVEYDFE